MNVISPDDLARGLVDLADPNDVPTGVVNISGALNGVLSVYKEWGKTPLETLNQIRVKFPVLEKAVLSYAGRLDPMAEGVMLVLVGDANKDREAYLGLDKVYEVEVLLGVSTDTGDVFGVPQASSTGDILKEVDELAINFKSKKSEDRHSLAHEDLLVQDILNNVVNTFVGKQSFDYPLYSSKTVLGKPLHQWVKEGKISMSGNGDKISEIEIPKTDVEIFSIKILDIYTVSTVDVLSKVKNAVHTIKGDFRFEEIESGWNEAMARKTGGASSFDMLTKVSRKIASKVESVSDCRQASFPIIKIQCSCSSGTYMRTLAEEIGKKIGVPALAYSIKRTKVGDIDVVSNAVIHL